MFQNVCIFSGCFKLFCYTSTVISIFYTRFYAHL